MENAFSSAQDLRPVKALLQRWTQDRFSYLKKPRPDHGLMLLIRGRIDFITRDATLSARAGDIIYLPGGCFYEAVFRREEGPVDNYLVNFESADLQTNADAPRLVLHNAPDACTECFRAFTELPQGQSLPPLRSRGLLLLLLDNIFRAMPGQTPSATLLDRAQTLLKTTESSVQEIARLCSVSESSLRALFRAHLHLSPSQYRLQSRLQHAARLLESTDMTVGEIADVLHFYDAAYFCRTFRCHFHMTPRKYAQSKRL